MKTETKFADPLSPAMFHILLALAASDLHGYGIIQEVEFLSDGNYRLGPGTLYDNLKKLMNQDWVEDVPQNALADDENRRHYRLTSQGRNILAADVSRIKTTLRIAGKRLANLGAR